MLRSVPEKSMKGFSIIEVLIAVAIFSVTMLVAAGSLVSLLDANQKARTQALVIGNLEAALNSMSRHIREGSEYLILDSGATIDYVRAGGVSSNSDDHTRFSFDAGSGRILRSDNGGVDYQPITSDDINIQNMSFELISNSIANELPRILVAVAGETTNTLTKTVSAFNVQTTISERAEVVHSASGGTTPPANSLCPFNTSEPGLYVISFESTYDPNNVLCTHESSEGGAYTFWTSCSTSFPEYVLSTPIPAGNYEVELVSHDQDHCASGCGNELPPNQDEEIYYLELRDNTTQTLTTATSTDIPSDVDTFQSIVATNQGIPFEVHSIVAHHGSDHATLANSLIPVCAAFREVEFTTDSGVF